MTIKSDFNLLVIAILLILSGISLFFYEILNFSTDNPQAFVIGATVISVILLFLPDLIMKRGDMADEHQKIKIRYSIALALLMNTAGEAGLYQLYTVGFEYDKLIHFLTSLLFTFVFAEILVRYHRFSFWKAAWVIGTLLLGAGIIWELFEALSDIFFETRVWGIDGQFITSDTLHDILSNCLGIFVALIMIHNRSQFVTSSYALIQKRAIFSPESKL